MYHGTLHGQSSACFGYNGVIQQALVLEMQSPTFNALNLEVIGWNGQVPQLDLYYLVKRLAEIGSGLHFAEVSDHNGKWYWRSFY